MRKVINLNFGWEFTENFSERFACGAGGSFKIVNIPHTCKETPFDYFDESVYQMVMGYRKRITAPKSLKNRHVFLIVGAAAHCAQVYVNGIPAGDMHRCGYTSFERDITGLLKEGKEAVISLCVNSREDQNVPPFGKVIDYMTYGGIYREVRLEIREDTYIEDIFLKPDISGKLESEITVFGDADSIVQTVIYNGEVIRKARFCLGEKYFLDIDDVKLWDTKEPNLYTVRTALIKDGKVKDLRITKTGFRKIEFKSDGLFLNGRRIRILGINRHQSYAYTGYAMPSSMQRYDADIIKKELGFNAVRTSHYPQSHHFIDRCDELGLLVFTEIPGWQHIGDEEWKNTALENVREMVMQYRNHPSIMLWGVRINESVDDDELYKKTNEIARTLDPSRVTGGVRCYKRSHLFEDVYTYNDFVHCGDNRGCDRKADVTSDINKPYLVSEYNGHMYPTKSFDDEEHRLEHALRHARVLNDISSHRDILGSFAWCLFDYNTHRDFGSGDRVCYHGICDMFRNRKLAADVYSVYSGFEDVLSVSSSMDIGEHPASNRGRVFIFTNADSVRMYKNGSFITEYRTENKEFPNLGKPPVEVDDYIGDQIQKNEGYSDKRAKYVKDILNDSTRFGMNSLSLKSKLKAAYLMLKYRMTFDDAYALYGKYIGNWGDEATVFRFDAVKDGRVVKSVSKGPFKKLVMKVDVSHRELIEDRTYDAASVRIKVCDQYGNVMPFYNGVIKTKIIGDISLIGPENIIIRGGMGGTYVKTVGKSTAACLKLYSDDMSSVFIGFTVKKKNKPVNKVKR